MTYSCLILGLLFAGFDVMVSAKTLKANIIRRVIFILSGLIGIYYMDSSYLFFTKQAAITGVVIGLLFAAIHLIISKGIKVKKQDIDSGFIYTCLLIYLIELPAEEFLYRGLLFIALIRTVIPVISIFIVSVIFLFLHLKTWDNKFVWMGSFILGVVCATSVYFTQSIWTAVIIHNFNDFAFLTLINKRNIFKVENLNIN